LGPGTFPGVAGLVVGAVWNARAQTLGQLGEKAGGLDYAAVGAAISPFNRRLTKDAAMARMMDKGQAKL